jgi:2-succinyl-6-hydroxy-2,4-cyclohexadiene-1-carboxylate synthase
MASSDNTLFCRISGNGDPVVFLHGFMEDLSIWESLMAAFPDKKCVAVDLHGHGESFFDAELQPSLPEMARQVRTLLDGLGIAHYHVVGHSLGGYVGCELLKSDANLEHLTLLHSHPWPDPETKKQDRNRVIELVKTKATSFIREAIPNLFAFPEEHPEAIRRYCAIAGKMDPAAIGWSSAAMRDRLSYVDVLKAASEAVSIIQGQLDPLIPNIKLRAFAEERGIAFYEIPRCGHMGQEEAPEKVKEILNVIIG